MYLNERSSGDRLAFSFDGVTNVSDPQGFHMRLREMELVGDTALLVRWEGVRRGEVLPTGVFHVRRVKEGDHDGG